LDVATGWFCFEGRFNTLAKFLLREIPQAHQCIPLLLSLVLDLPAIVVSDVCHVLLDDGQIAETFAHLRHVRHGQLTIDHHGLNLQEQVIAVLRTSAETGCLR
jgi:hypothetical protein